MGYLAFIFLVLSLSGHPEFLPAAVLCYFLRNPDRKR